MLSYSFILCLISCLLYYVPLVYNYRNNNNLSYILMILHTSSSTQLLVWYQLVMNNIKMPYSNNGHIKKYDWTTSYSMYHRISFTFISYHRCHISPSTIETRVYPVPFENCLFNVQTNYISTNANHDYLDSFRKEQSPKCPFDKAN